MDAHAHARQPVIETDRLVLRRPRRDDADDLARIYADPEVMRHLGSGHPVGREEAATSLEAMLGRFDADGFGMLIVVRKHDEKVLGRCGILVWDASTWSPSTLRDAVEPEVELGWTLAREFWGFGFATEAALAVRDFALRTLDRRRLISLIQAENARSIRVAEKLGMNYERDVLLARPARLYALTVDGNPPAR